MKYFFPIWIVISLCSCLWGKVNLSEFDQQRPVDGIYDPGDWIHGPARHALIRDLSNIKDSSGIDMLVAVMETAGGSDPQELAEELANRWGYHGGRALILYIPENPESPWIAVSGLIRSEIPPAALDKMINDAKQRARTDPTAAGAVTKAVGSLGEDLRFVAAREARGMRSETRQPPPTIRQLVFFFFRSAKVLIIVAGVGIVGVFLVVYLSYRLWKKLRTALVPRTFPEISWKRRFGAPYAGIVYTYSPKNKLQRRHDS